MAKTGSVYLSGAMLGCTDGECRDWREYAKQHLLYDTLDPMVRDYRDRPMDGMTDMVINDKLDIERCHTVLVNFIKPSVGTSMEVLFAWERGKTVILVVPPGTEISPWLVFHSHHVFYSINEAIDHINNALPRLNPTVSIAPARPENGEARSGNRPIC